MKKSEIIFYSGTIIVSLSAFLYAATFPSDAAYFPRLVSALIIFFCSILLIRALTKARNVQKNEKEYSEKENTEDAAQQKSSDARWRPAIVSVMLIVYCLLFEKVGYTIPTALLIGGTTYLFGCRKWIRIVLVSTITTILLYVIFRFLLSVSFPSDSWFF